MSVPWLLWLLLSLLRCQANSTGLDREGPVWLTETGQFFRAALQTRLADSSPDDQIFCPLSMSCTSGRVLIVDSGDLLIGTPLFSFFRGEPDVAAMNIIGYHAMAVGNHDFDFGLDHLRRLRAASTFPMLCSNLSSRGDELPCQPSVVIHLGDLTVGLIGLLGRSNFPDTFNREVVRLLELTDPVETARALARRLKTEQGADLVVVVTHEDTE